jgi:transposase
MDLTDEQWLLIQPLLPPLRASGGRGRPPLDQRALINGILWKLRNNRPWRTVPSRYGSHQASYQRYDALKKSGLMASILKTLKKDLRTRGSFDYEKYLRDGIVFVANIKGKYVFYILPEYAEDWRVSTSLIFYREVSRKIEECNCENQY